MKLIQSLAFGFVLFLSVNTYGQDTTATRKTKTGIAAIPMINYNRTQGVVAGAMISGFYKVNSLDTVSPSSSSGIIGIYKVMSYWHIHNYILIRTDGGFLPL